MDINRSRFYYKPKLQNDTTNIVIKKLHEKREKFPFYGYRRMTAILKKDGLKINRKKVLKLMRHLNFKTIYPKKKTTIKNKLHKTYPYLLKGLNFKYPNQAWETDITYIKN